MNMSVFILRPLLYLCLGCCLLWRGLEAHRATPLHLISSTHTNDTRSGPLVVLDAGHGGSDDGAKVRHLQEKSITLLTALYAKKELEALGYRVLLTRSRDIYVSLPKRVNLANKTEGAIFVSIHFNSAKNQEAEGVEIFFYREAHAERTIESRKLALKVLHGIIEKTASASRGVKAGNFYVIRETKMPAIIVEAGFMTNREEWGCLRKKSYLEKIARGVAMGIDRYLQR